MATAKKPFGGKQAPPFGKKDSDKDKDDKKTKTPAKKTTSGRK
jgi:hypothetical protein